ncbi:hypothetical protein AOQ84DRAFT_228031 [Glonium stellatum]|uniref:Uncharacterized protein n=1 Tax=Glonium stellatum TaxID=574774 RepID=A0A8E2F871_9PEZI|nr:hypothetical protein AOQ84DRAFT_228031 [Glonium stellatum]
MSTARCYAPFWLFFTTISAIALANEPINVLKRSPVLEDRQECANPAWIPACPGFFACIPPGGICCSDGFTYVMPPETCPDGTQPIATAITASTPAPTITRAPTTAAISTQIYYSYEWYTAEFTWYYWYYYYTYIALSTVLTSTEITTYTTVSFSATDSVKASALFSSFSYTMRFPTPTQTVTSLIGAPPASFSAFSTSTSASTPTSATSTVTTVTTSASTAPATTSPAAVFTGAAAALRTSVTILWSGALWVVGGTALIPGVMMMWL